MREEFVLSCYYVVFDCFSEGDDYFNCVLLLLNLFVLRV